MSDSSSGVKDPLSQSLFQTWALHRSSDQVKKRSKLIGERNEVARLKGEGGRQSIQDSIRS